ncbi:MAG: AAA family ATPase [Paracoccaceae bacterium]|nr:AAA family ATPase [Paracoccaceae bacterium]
MNDASTMPQPEAFEEGSSGIAPTAFVLRDPKDIPPRQWLYGKHLVRGFVSLTVSPGGLGKSSLLIAEALAMATAWQLFGDTGLKPLRVWYWNGEDPKEEIERRVAAACLHYNITNDDLAGQFMADSGRDVPICVAKTERSGVAIAEPVVAALIDAIKRHQIDVIIIDPFVTSHLVDENDTTAMNAVVAQWRAVADKGNCAVELVHHVNKAGAIDPKGQGIYASRGAGAVIDGVRSARSLSLFPPAELENMGLDPWEGPYIQVVDGKANLAQKSTVQWRTMIGVKLNNGKAHLDVGDEIGVCIETQPPTQGEPVADGLLHEICEMLAGRSEPAKQNIQNHDWVGYAIAEHLKWDVGRGVKKADLTSEQNGVRHKIKGILSQLTKRGFVKPGEAYDARSGRTVTVVEVVQQPASTTPETGVDG